MTQHTTPIACSIPLTEASNRNKELQDLFARARTRERIDAGVVVAFDLDMIAAVEDLVAREAQCCGFLSMMIDTDDSELRLTVTTDEPARVRLIDQYVGLGVRHDG